MSAERQRRYRAHKHGDHSLCLPESCGRAGEDPAGPGVVEQRPTERRPDVPPVLPVAEPESYGPRGQQLWDALEGEIASPGHRVLLEEACRVADRLDRIDGILAARRDWIRISTLDLGENVKVRITLDGVLAEARQQQLALRALVAEVQSARPKQEPEKPAEEGGPLADLLAFAARRRSPAG